jgi:hypothetical protein
MERHLILVGMASASVSKLLKGCNRRMWGRRQVYRSGGKGWKDELHTHHVSHLDYNYHKIVRQERLGRTSGITAKNRMIERCYSSRGLMVRYLLLAEC